MNDNCDQLLRDAGATLELFVATGGVVAAHAETRVRIGAMAAAVRRVMADG